MATAGKPAPVSGRLVVLKGPSDRFFAWTWMEISEPFRTKLDLVMLVSIVQILLNCKPRLAQQAPACFGACDRCLDYWNSYFGI